MEVLARMPVCAVGQPLSHIWLQECLGENDRDWRKCQKEVQALKECHAKLAALKQQPAQQQK